MGGQSQPFLLNTKSFLCSKKNLTVAEHPLKLEDIYFNKSTFHIKNNLQF